jgi:mannose-6-phosphate isomerase-like protein (cupin superfamily)
MIKGLLFPVIFIPFLCMGQSVIQADQLLAELQPGNPQCIHTDSLVSTFLIVIQDSVALHLHEAHTEQVFVVAGMGMLQLGDESHQLVPGTWVVIPIGTPHKAVSTGKEPLKVISIQAPGFDGTDRVFLKE